MSTATTPRYAPGRFCWTELHAVDPAASRAFYAKLFGWEATELPLPDGDVYTMLGFGGRQAAALTPAREGGTRWQSYLATDDLDASVERARTLGATVLAGPYDVLEAGRMARLLDPTGLPLCLWQGRRRAGADLQNDEAGSMCWHDVFSRNPEATVAFLTGLFGYEVETAETPHGPFMLLAVPGRGSKELALHRAQEDWAPIAQPFFSTADADATHATAVALGAEVLCPPMDAGGSRFAHFRDPQGASFGVFEWADR